MRLLSATLIFSVLISGIANAQSPLESHLALTTDTTLKALEANGYSLGSQLMQSASIGNIGNDELSKLPPFQPIFQNLLSEIPSRTMGGRPFDLNFLENKNARFVLVGLVNRVDRGYSTGDRCGEIRFVYRLAYHVTARGKSVFSRLPMTINLVYRAGVNSSDQHCAQVAASWLRMNKDSKSSDWTTSGPLSPEFFRASNLKALEINMQTERSGAGAPGAFGGNAIYLLKVYEWDGKKFEESVLENQVDRSALISNPALLAELKAWLFDPRNAKAIDDGTFLLPKKFLAKKAYSIAPGGIARSANRIYFDLIKPEEIKPSVYSELVQIRSADGFLRRLNDSTCTGCHQTRAIGGFHFTGRDPFGKYGGNSVFLPGSAHFMGDLPRRREILNSVASGSTKVDFSRGFSARPQASRSQNLDGSGLLNGWGSHCANGNDATFKSWTCAKDFVCKNMLDVSDKSGMGICINPVQKVGDPCEFGKTVTKSFGVDFYTRLNERKITTANAMCSPQSQDPGTLTGGFLGGSIRLLSCQDRPGDPELPPEATCGPLPASGPGFNRCIGLKNFDECLKQFSVGVGLRGCDQKNPCRDDYICAESFKADRGVCVPPYFLFQFRVDGHPKGDL